METVFKPFVDRFSQPIILSFIVAWIFWNWKIPLGLIWYNNESICLLGYTGYEDLIEKNNNFGRNYIYPLLTAFLYPFIILIANNFTALIRKLDIKLLHLISKGSIVPWELYHNVLKVSEEREKSISAFVSKEQSLNTQLLTLETNNTQLSENLRLVSEENSRNTQLVQIAKDDISEKLQILNTYEKFSGREWLVGHHSVELWNDSSTNTLKTLLNMKAFFYIDKDHKFFLELKNNVGELTFEIEKYYYNIINQKIIFHLSKVNEHSYTTNLVSAEESLPYVIFRDLNDTILEFKLTLENSILRSKIKADNSFYKIEII